MVLQVRRAQLSENKARRAQADASAERDKAQIQRNEALRARAESEAQARFAHDQQRLAEQQKQAAEAARDRALRAEAEASARQLAAWSETLKSQVGALTLSTLLALESNRILPLPENRSALWRPLQLLGRPRVLFRVSDRMRDLALSRSGKRIAVATENTIEIHDFATGGLERRINTGSGYRSLSFSPDERFIVANQSSNESATHIWKPDNGRENPSVRSSSSWVPPIISSDSRWVATADGNAVRLWDPETSQLIRSLNYQAEVTSIALNREGKWLAACTGNTTHIWEVSSGGELASLPHTYKAQKLVISPDGQWNATLAYNTGPGAPGLGELQVWQVDGWREKLRKQIRAPSSLTMTPNASWMLVHGLEYTHVIDLSTGSESAFSTPEGVSRAAISPSGQWFAGALRGGSITIWDANANRELSRLEGSGIPANFAITPAGDSVVTGTDDGSVALWTPPRASSARFRFSADQTSRLSSATVGGTGLGTTLLIGVEFSTTEWTAYFRCWQLLF